MEKVGDLGLDLYGGGLRDSEKKYSCVIVEKAGEMPNTSVQFSLLIRPDGAFLHGVAGEMPKPSVQFSLLIRPDGAFVHGVAGVGNLGLDLYDNIILRLRQAKECMKGESRDLVVCLLSPSSSADVSRYLYGGGDHRVPGLRDTASLPLLVA